MNTLKLISLVLLCFWVPSVLFAAYLISPRPRLTRGKTKDRPKSVSIGLMRARLG
jgi:hypothetical protein